MDIENLREFSNKILTEFYSRFLGRNSEREENLLCKFSEENSERISSEKFFQNFLFSSENFFYQKIYKILF